jgi:hypothetical protein
MSIDTKESVDMVETTSESQNPFPEREKGTPEGTPVGNLAEVGKPPNPWGKEAKKLYMMCALVYFVFHHERYVNLITFLPNGISESHKDMMDL